MPRDLGDFQTPRALVDAVLERLRPLGPFTRVLEPTCGRGNFIAGLLDSAQAPREILGIERQAEHVAAARALSETAPEGTRVAIRHADLFGFDLAAFSWQTDGPLLVVGNPPWVTSAALGALQSDNQPARRRMAGLGGLAARTGASNFDLAEAVWLEVLRQLGHERPVVALLCKATTARRVLQQAWREGLGLEEAAIYTLSGRRWFGAQVAACLFVARAGGPVAELPAVRVYASLEAGAPERTTAVVSGELVADLEAWRSVRSLDGACRREWRQGVKHDASAVMELTRVDGGWVNGLGEVVDVEPEARFPLMKGTDLARGRWPPSRAVLVTQRTLGESTDDLAQRLPKLWAYLCRHGARLDARRSSIYRGRPRFSMFGIGDYSFAPHKVAVSGLHAPPRFRALGPHAGRSVLVDDTCYLLECADGAEAERLAWALESAPARAFFAALTFTDAKRPVTKRLLQRLDLQALLAEIG